jgi:hypothetical protein
MMICIDQLSSGKGVILETQLASRVETPRGPKCGKSGT